MITFSNDFHQTVHVSDKKVGDVVSWADVRDIWHDLCGTRGCTCGGNGGVRGGEASFEPTDGTGLRYVIVAEPGKDRP